MENYVFLCSVNHFVRDGRSKIDVMLKGKEILMIVTFRSSNRRCFIEKAVLKNFAIFTEKTPALELDSF